MQNWIKRAAFALAVMALGIGSINAEVIYHRGNSADPETLDHHKTSTTYEAHIMRDLYEGLVIYDAKGKVVPGVAESWTISDDGRTYTFKLRPDAKWSNGDPVTAGDFVFALKRIMMPETGAKYANILYPIKNAEKINKSSESVDTLGVKALDTHTLKITLEAPTPYFLELLTHQTALPLHEKTVKQYSSDFVQPGKMVSNGAYKLVEFIPNDKLILVRNKYFHDNAEVQIDKVIFYPTEDRGAALRRFQAGELHSNNNAPMEQITFMRENLGGQLRIAPFLGTYYYAINMDKKKFADVRVRQALSMAIDREFIADKIWGSSMVPAYSFVPPGISNYDQPAYADYKDIPIIDREEKAIELLNKAGYGPNNPLSLEIRYNTSENHKNTAIAIADMWKPLGVQVTMLNTDTKTHYALLRDKGDFDIARAGWIGDYSDPQNFLFMIESDNDGFNYANYKNSEYDALMKKAAATVDLKKRAALLHNAEQIFMRDLPLIPLLHDGSLSLISNKLKGWEDNIVNVHATRWMRLEE